MAKSNNNSWFIPLLVIVGVLVVGGAIYVEKQTGKPVFFAALDQHNAEKSEALYKQAKEKYNRKDWLKSINIAILFVIFCGVMLNA